MDFKSELIERVTTEIQQIMEFRGKVFAEAVEIVRGQSVAGPAVWDQVLARFAAEGHTVVSGER